MSKKKEEMIDDEIEFVDEPEIVVLKGSDGREEELLLLAEIDYGDAVYAILQPSDLKDMEDDEVFVFEIEEAENGDRNYRPVEDKELAQSVMDDYNELRMGCDCDCEDCECEGCDEECENAEECDKDCKKK